MNAAILLFAISQFTIAGLMLDFSQGEWTLLAGCTMWTMALSGRC